jgi:hypothetical protein
MNETMNIGLSPEDKRRKQEQKDAELLADHLARHPEPVISPENLREAEPEIAQFESMIAVFESTHSLAELHSIINLTPAEASKHPIREPARIALIPIVAMFNTLKKETNISPIKYEELKAKYMRLSRAVGIINNNKVDHNR